MEKKLIDYEGFEAYSKGVQDKYAEKKDIPTSLSSLKEDSNHRTVQDSEKTKWDNVTNKVDKVDGKQLSSNDYTDEDKMKVDAIPDNPKYTDTTYDLSNYATKTELSGKIDKSQITDEYIGESQEKVVSQKAVRNLADIFDSVISSIRMDVDKKAGKSEIPTKISQLTNDKAFKTEAEIQELINNSTKLKKEVVTSLPTTGKDDVIYLVKDDKGKDNNNYLEYLWLNGKYELIGSTQVDLSDYLKTKDLKNAKLRTNKNSIHVFTDRSKSETDLDILLGDLELRTEQNKKNIESRIKNDDIQEFTQQELEEAFK